MKGLELSKKYYEEYGKNVWEGSFKDYLPFISIGLIGEGSEVQGFDDELSRDHDYEPGFCVFLPDESIVDRKVMFSMERAYSKLPDDFMGYKRQKISPVGGARHGVFRREDFLFKVTGHSDGRLTNEEWLRIPMQYLREATKGEIFFDGDGYMTETRRYLSEMPEDVRLKRIASNLLLAKQAGQYNFERCVKRGETAAGVLCVNEYVNRVIAVLFLLNGEYPPYYKWRFRALKELTVLSELALPLEMLLTQRYDEKNANERIEAIDFISFEIAKELMKEKISDAICNDLEKHAYSVNDRIKDGDIRNLHILSADGI